MRIELTDKQESEIDEIKWQYEDALRDDIGLRKNEFTETVTDLHEEMKDDIKDLRRESKDEMKEEIRILKESWR